MKRRVKIYRIRNSDIKSGFNLIAERHAEVKFPVGRPAYEHTGSGPARDELRGSPAVTQHARRGDLVGVGDVESERLDRNLETILHRGVILGEVAHEAAVL